MHFQGECILTGDAIPPFLSLCPFFAEFWLCVWVIQDVGF